MSRLYAAEMSCLIKRRQVSHSRCFVTIHRSIDLQPSKAAGLGKRSQEEAQRMGAGIDLKDLPTGTLLIRNIMLSTISDTDSVKHSLFAGVYLEVPAKEEPRTAHWSLVSPFQRDDCHLRLPLITSNT